MYDANELCPIDPVTGVGGELLDYHIGSGKAINDGGPANALVIDFDNDTRQQYGGFDIGADQLVPVP